MCHIRTFGALVALVVLLGACSGVSSEPETVTVEYIVSDNLGGDISLTYTNGDGNIEQQQVTLGPLEFWSVEYEMDPDAFVSISAQRGTGNGLIRCSIVADGDRIEHAESTGEFVIASCSGSVP